VKDGLTVNEMVGTVLGLTAIWASAFVSWLRAKNLSWLANILGPIIGRSLPSFGRRLLVILAGLLARATAQPELAPDVLAQMPLVNILGTLGLVALANWSSATEDAKRNPVATKAAVLGLLLLLTMPACTTTRIHEITDAKGTVTDTYEVEEVTAIGRVGYRVGGVLALPFVGLFFLLGGDLSR